jgi:hypothetical protein
MRNVKTEFKNSFKDGTGWKGDIPDFWLDCSKLKRYCMETKPAEKRGGRGRVANVSSPFTYRNL